MRLGHSTFLQPLRSYLPLKWWPVLSLCTLVFLLCFWTIFQVLLSVCLQLEWTPGLLFANSADICISLPSTQGHLYCLKCHDNIVGTLERWVTVTFPIAVWNQGIKTRWLTINGGKSSLWNGREKVEPLVSTECRYNFLLSFRIFQLTLLGPKSYFLSSCFDSNKITNHSLPTL